METKLAKLTAAIAEGRTIDALRIAARFPDLGDHRDPITKAWAAHQHPDMYRAMGHDPDSLVAAGVSAICSRYSLERPPSPVSA